MTPQYISIPPPSNHLTPTPNTTTTPPQYGGAEDPAARHKIIQKQATQLAERNDAEGLMRLIAHEAFASPDGGGRGYGGLLPPELAQVLASGAPAPPNAPPVGFDVGNACICLSRCVGIFGVLECGGVVGWFTHICVHSLLNKQQLTKTD